MERCRFSIIVVCYNAGDKLAKTVNSILAQDYESYEIVVQDGCSADGSVEKLRAAQEGNGKLAIFVEKDNGIYDAMNKALAKVKGQAVHFLNCGDTFPSPDILKKAAAFMDKHKNAGICYGNILMKRPIPRWRLRRRLRPLCVTGIFPAIRRVFMKKGFLKRGSMTYLIKCVRTTSIFSGAACRKA